MSNFFQVLRQIFFVKFYIKCHPQAHLVTKKNLRYTTKKGTNITKMSLLIINTIKTSFSKFMIILISNYSNSISQCFYTKKTLKFKLISFLIPYIA